MARQRSRRVRKSGGETRYHVPLEEQNRASSSAARAVSAAPLGVPKSLTKSLQEARSAYEREFVLRKLEENRWNMTKAAAALGLERSHLYRKMRALGIAPSKVS